MWPPVSAPTGWTPATPGRIPDDENRVADPAPSLDEGTPPAPHRGPLLDLWNGLQRTWLDLSAPPLAERAAAAGFSADRPSAYCSRCGHSTGPFEATAAGCPACAGKRFPWARIVRLGEYRPPLTTFIHEVKFTRWRRLGVDLGTLLGESVNASLAPHKARGALPPVVIVPVPITFRRRLVRGVDHTGAIASGLARATGGEVVYALSRRHRPSQVSLPISERAANVAQSIYPKKGIDLGGSLVIVVDDVTTTGATLRAACRAVRKCCSPPPKSGTAHAQARPPIVWGAVLAVTPVPGRRNAPGHGGQVGGAAE